MYFSQKLTPDFQQLTNAFFIAYIFIPNIRMHIGFRILPSANRHASPPTVLQKPIGSRFLRQTCF